MHSSGSNLALASILRLMLYVAARNEASEFVENLYGTKAGNRVMKSLTSKEQHEDETISQSSLQTGLTNYLENISTR